MHLGNIYEIREVLAMDIHDFKSRLERTEKRIQRAAFSDKNKRIISDYQRQLFIKELSIARVDKHLTVLKKIGERIEKDFDCLDKDDIYAFLEWIQRRNITDWSKYGYKQVFKAFLRYLNKDDLANLITIKNVRVKIPDIFTRQEVLRMIETAPSPMDKALIASLYETGCRIGEIASLQNKDVNFDNYGAIFIVSGKTGMRRIRVIFSAPYLSTWREMHPKKLDPGAPFWIRFGKNGRTSGLENNVCHPLLYPALTKRIKKIARAAGIQKRVYNHLFRHTSATEKSEILTTAQMCEYFGWTQGSKMCQTYVHLSGRNLDDTLFKAYGISKDNGPKEKELIPIQCPRCGTANGATGKFCCKCGAALDIQTAINLDKERESMTMQLMELISRHPDIMDVLKKSMERDEKGGTIA